MKKKLLSILLCLVMVVGLLPTAAFAAGYVEINEANFPDANFRSYVQTEFDKDGDNKLSSAEIAAVKEIIAYAKGIKNLKGIEFFTVLETLNCVQCELTELDVSENTNLTILRCESNHLAELDVSQNSKLERLYCRNNMLAVLDVSKNSKLARIDCGKNGLTSLNLDQNEKIEYVNLNDYQFANKGTLPAGVF